VLFIPSWIGRGGWEDNLGAEEIMCPFENDVCYPWEIFKPNNLCGLQHEESFRENGLLRGSRAKVAIRIAIRNIN
jgi:hypothetical protein